MNRAVNLTNLRTITGGDTGLEAELFEAFLSSSDECLTKMRASMEPGQEQNWRASAHAFKGISMGLGAFHLGELCLKAQNSDTSSPSDKQHILSAIEQALAEVKTQLETEGVLR